MLDGKLDNITKVIIVNLDSTVNQAVMLERCLWQLVENRNFRRYQEENITCGSTATRHQAARQPRVRMTNILGDRNCIWKKSTVVL
jgi:hypothetical protein